MADLVSQGDPIEKAHISTLQEKCVELINVANFPEDYEVSFSENKDRPKADFINELREVVNALETSFSGNCNCTDCWECDCCQTCQTCQTSKCQSQCGTNS